MQNKLAQRARELRLHKGDSVFEAAGKETLVLAADPEGFALVVDGIELPDAAMPPVFGEGFFNTGRAEDYDAVAQRGSIALTLDKEEFAWMREVPIFRLRLTQLAEKRAIYVQRVRRRAQPTSSAPAAG